MRRSVTSWPPPPPSSISIIHTRKYSTSRCHDTRWKLLAIFHFSFFIFCVSADRTQDMNFIYFWGAEEIGVGHGQAKIRIDTHKIQESKFVKINFRTFFRLWFNPIFVSAHCRWHTTNSWPVDWPRQKRFLIRQYLGDCGIFQGSKANNQRTRDNGLRKHKWLPSIGRRRVVAGSSWWGGWCWHRCIAAVGRQSFRNGHWWKL